MEDVKMLFRYIVENKFVLFATVAGMLLGAGAGVQAFYHGWLG